ncbi:glycosyltransferase family 4 protein [Xanthobacter tagetidis]|uniref:Glycosyltransferase family 1 protein n=1 Tax=Xanthobacter tagetidis TaxID=60216 RepID=A0A3L7A070_9HYPH|nr:glycosyltransferase family 1 protein [Xanthobacter tagetidis]MBB6309499.1 glycosyltransferase involved in cell wall biosynthesis [Xanthobacter tagetidis]RLP73609.1 glycosyltransferase family 1 protein [Xanthobacter tagetidis]
MRVLVATDAWHPQINGVVRSLEHTAAEAANLGAEMEFLTPQGFRTLPLPSYNEIRLALATPRMIMRRIEAVQPDFVHIATEGPIGMLVRRACIATRRTFTTSYHTKFPEYLSARAPVPERLTYAWLRSFHNAAGGVMVSTATLERELEARGFKRLMRWSRGVDAELFRPRPEADLPGVPGPRFLFVGRVAVEKNIEAFLSLDLPGSKVVVGGGPALASLKQRYPEAHFLGPKEGEELAQVYAACDVFCFPSRTDTFGIVLLEALASGLPVAAYPVTGPKDVLADMAEPVGVLDEDLRNACLKALELSKDAARRFALNHTWRESARQFLDNVLIAHDIGPIARRYRLRRRARVVSGA